MLLLTLIISGLNMIAIELKKSLNQKEKLFYELFFDQARVTVVPIKFTDFQLVNLIDHFFKNKSYKHKFFSRLGKIDEVDTLLISGIDKWNHFFRTILGFKINFRCKHECEIFLSKFRVC